MENLATICKISTTLFTVSFSDFDPYFYQKIKNIIEHNPRYVNAANIASRLINQAGLEDVPSDPFDLADAFARTKKILENGIIRENNIRSQRRFAFLSASHERLVQNSALGKLFRGGQGFEIASGGVHGKTLTALCEHIFELAEIDHRIDTNRLNLR